jgi:hypothetical protein
MVPFSFGKEKKEDFSKQILYFCLHANTRENASCNPMIRRMMYLRIQYDQYHLLVERKRVHSVGLLGT